MQNDFFKQITINNTNLKISQSIFFLFFVLMIGSCKKYDELLPENAYPRAYANIIRTETLTINDNILEFELDFQPKILVGEIDNFITIEEKDINLNLTIFETIQLDAELLELECSKNFPIDDTSGPYSISLLLDQSGSMRANDSLLQRVQICQNIIDVANPDDEISLLAFSGSYGQQTDEPTVVLQNFTNDHQLVSDALDQIPNRTGGGTPLFESINEGINFCINKGNHLHKAIIVMTDEGASDNSERVDSLLCLSRTENVKVHAVSFNSNTIANSQLNELVVGSRGALMDRDIALGIPSIQSLMNNDYFNNILFDFFYRTRWSVTKPGNLPWEIGDIVSGRVTLRISNEIVLKVPFTLLVC